MFGERDYDPLIHRSQRLTRLDIHIDARQVNKRPLADANELSKAVSDLSPLEISYYREIVSSLSDYRLLWKLIRKGIDLDYHI
jgi:hypothetical protein